MTLLYYICAAQSPPDNIRLAQVSRNVLTFQWDPVQLICSSYKINAVGCGACPNATLNTSVTCVVSNLLTNNSICTLSIETTVCGFQRNISEAATALLKGIQVDFSSFSMGHYLPVL